MFLPFAGGYYLSYLYRSVNAVIAEDLSADVGLSASDLGLLTSAYFVAFAAFQIPLGLLLDRYGARKVHGLLLLLAALGALGFALGDGLLQLWLARALIGLGVAGGLMAALKAITQWFPESRWPVVNGCFLAMGGLGAMSATAPVEALLQVTDWRGIFVGLAAATLRGRDRDPGNRAGPAGHPLPAVARRAAGGRASGVRRPLLLAPRADGVPVHGDQPVDPGAVGRSVAARRRRLRACRRGGDAVPDGGCGHLSALSFGAG